METSKPQSFFKDIKSRELHGFRVRKRPYIDNSLQSFDLIGAVAVKHYGDPSPPMSLSFCQTIRNAHIVATADEMGYVSLFNTRCKFMDLPMYEVNTAKSKVSEWFAHDNAIFDICWIKEDTHMLTASGDQSIKLWDVQEKKCIGALVGHTGSVKSISSHPTNMDLVVSGSRDGSFALWDMRSSSKANQSCILPITSINAAHIAPGRRQMRRGKAASRSITSVLYLRDEVSVATAGAVDSVIKFWDTRHLKAPIIHACPSTESYDEKGKKLHGISCLSQDKSGVLILASCMDHRNYLYNILQLEKGAMKTFSGGRTESFFVKSAISPDGTQILGGSSDGNAYIWQVNKPHMDPIALKNHEGEVTSVNWCPSETGKVATCSDDYTVRFWNINGSCYSSSRSPSSIRKRIRALPSTKARELFIEETSCAKNGIDNQPSDSTYNTNSPSPMKMPEVKTPESQKKRISFNFEAQENVARTPEGDNRSPSSVLNPPSSLKKKTIRDYFSVS